ncbi:hypothetical protein O181_035954 [Austropuccinia psidii MF-1]|uniref:FHA domain-containing protein n=1 Tax=Austropuccinia psidii MF-1 TaxID=1389203 RepID=A0A9Q3HB24_9BASI|nr:hypothetical protein [Austropuccinia psidii MF-1]
MPSSPANYRKERCDGSDRDSKTGQSTAERYRTKWDNVEDRCEDKYLDHPRKRRSSLSQSPREREQAQTAHRREDHPGPYRRPQSRSRSPIRQRHPQEQSSRRRSVSPGSSRQKVERIKSAPSHEHSNSYSETSTAVTPQERSKNLQEQQQESRLISEEAQQTNDSTNFEQSGKLAAETKTYKGVVLKYHEPAEARKPTKKWRLYVFKDDQQVDLFHIHRQSAYLFGRDRVVVDIPIDHPSSSKQHAVMQFRQITDRNEFGDCKTLVKPFIIDLESANGTKVNNEKIPASRFYELQSGDVIKFGMSTREFVLIPEE